jgi:hypothetical protein
MSNAQMFEHNGYVHLKGFLDELNCQELTAELKRLVAEKKTVKDEQCPLSEAIHGTVTFDKLLEDLLPHFEEHCGKKLYPTYSYARLYKPGEELKVHRDRPACEISATVTLGFSGKQWAIYMGDQEDKSDGNEILMSVGDAVLYRGMDKYHWREKFEGEWQAQVFLHYVDADGKHADQKFDGRESLGLPKDMVQNLSDHWALPNGITNGFCDNLIKEYSKPETHKEPPHIGGDTGTIDLNIRNVQRVILPQNVGIGSTLTAFGLNSNHHVWKYDITHSNQTEFLMYEPSGKYETHVDTFHQHSSETRKLTVLAFLNDDFEGGRFYIQNGSERSYPLQEKGTLLVFPSYMPHGVEPITKGVRYSVVTWMVGPYFK